MDTYGKISKNVVLQWGELPTSVGEWQHHIQPCLLQLYTCTCNVKCYRSRSAYISTGQIMGWGHKAIEIRSAETGHLDGVFMHKKAQKLKFLCERNDKVRCEVSICLK